MRSEHPNLRSSKRPLSKQIGDRVFGINLAVDSVNNLSVIGEAMHSGSATTASLTPNDVSYILNLICPRCGGPLGGGLKAFSCQGRCRKDWRPEWESSSTPTMLDKAASRRPRPTNIRGRISPRRHPWRGAGRLALTK